MKALTVQQPWAWAIVHGGKNVENRTQLWSHRGELAIHAGRRLSERGRESRLVIRAVGDAMRRDEPVDFAYGAIIGLVDVVDAHWQEPGCCESPWAEALYVEHGGRVRKRISHLEVTRPRPLQVPVPCRGALGLWTVPSGVDDQVLAQLEVLPDA